MKILAIRTENLASLAGKTEIDFRQEPLASAGIFAITGVTGAGKSTILDAICLALYAKTPRFLGAENIKMKDSSGNDTSTNDFSKILRDGTGSGFAEVEFIGLDGQCYKAKWEIRRANNKPTGSLQGHKIYLENIDTNTKIGGKNTEVSPEIEKLIGLNFEQFTRAVLLAQGDFAAFLRAKDKDKSAILEKLTGAEIYTKISKTIFEKYKEAKKDLQYEEAKKGMIAILSDEAIMEKENEKVKIAEEIAICKTEIDNYEIEKNWYILLIELEKKYQEAQKAQAQAAENKQNVAARELKLRQIAAVQVTKTWVNALQIAKKQEIEKNEKLQQIENKITILEKQQKETAAKQEQASIEYEKTKSTKQAAIPLLEEAKKLDTLLNEKKEQVITAEKTYQEISKTYQNDQNEIAKKQVELSKLSNNITELKKWKEDNKSRQSIAENIAIIETKLADAEKLLAISKQNSENIEKNKEQINQKKQQKETSKIAFTEMQIEVENLQISYKKEEEKLLLVEIETLKNEKIKADDLSVELTKAVGQWKNLYDSSLNLKQIETNLANLQQEKTEKETLLYAVTQELAAAKIAKDVSGKLLDKARLSATENVESLRNQLVAGDACIVCGSTNHPYSTHNPQLDKVLESIALQHNENVKAYEKCLQTESSLKGTCENLQKNIQQLTTDFNKQKNSVEILQTSWNNLGNHSENNSAIHTIIVEIATITDAEKESFLAKKLQENKLTQTSLKKQIEAYEVEQKEVKILENKFLTAQKDLTKLENSVKENETNLQFLEEKTQNLEAQELNILQNIAEVEQKLGIYFTNPDWFANWKKEPNVFVGKLSVFAKNWQVKIQELEKISQNYEILGAELATLATQTERQIAEIQQKEGILAKEKEKMQELIQNRQAIFGGEMATKVENDLNVAMEMAQKNVDTFKAAIENINTEITKIATEQNQIKVSLQEIEQIIVTNHTNIEQWLQKYEQEQFVKLDYEQLHILLNFDETWQKQEMDNLRKIDDELTKSRSILEEREQTLQQHKNKQISKETNATTFEEVENLLAIQKSNLEQATSKSNKIFFDLQQDQDNKIRLNDLLKLIVAKQKIADNWYKLDELIGSGDGKKFREIAQQYTLDVLLSYANVHLSEFSDRYLIARIPESLGLQVIDKNMGDEIRSVFSLSGGESFLMSLGLALGLASLSSNKMKIESLFIDEGFGSLDIDTLNIVMDALERLHHQGRKVGVISHVQEMTERIQTQVRVSKLGSGKSKVEIVG